MQKLTSRPPADFTAVNQAAFRDLTVRQASFTAGAMHAGQEAASAPVTERLALAGLGTITIRSVLHLVLVTGHVAGELVARHDRAAAARRGPAVPADGAGRPAPRSSARTARR